MNEQNETTRTEPAATVGDIMTESTREAVKKFVLFLSVIVYLGGLIYAEVHGWNVLSKGINPDMQIWAGLGMIALGITAIALPLALHSWTFEPMQRYAAFGFYALDIALLGVNAFTDFNVNTGQALAPWARNYLTYVLPTTPVIAAIGWSILWLLDPSSRALVLRQTLRESIIKAKANQIAQAAKAQNVNRAVQAAAEREVQDALADLFGKPVTVNDGDDDGWQIWRDGYEQGKRYQSDAPKVENSKADFDKYTQLLNEQPTAWECLNCHSRNPWENVVCTGCGYSRDKNGLTIQEDKPDQGSPFPGG